MTTEPEPGTTLLAAKLGALARHRWDAAPDARPSRFPGGASLADPSGGRYWALLEGPATEEVPRRLGAALAIAYRAGASEIHLMTEDRDAAGVLARRASLFAPAPTVWWAEGADLHPAETAPAPVEPPAPGAELYRPVLGDAGITPVVEGGVLIGEHLGLEVARVVINPDGSARLEAGVGRIDREAAGVVWAELGEAASLERVRAIVAAHRHPGAERHPLNQLVPERWLRAVVVANPALAGAAVLRPVGSALPRRNLRENGVATAVGEDPQGAAVVVTCSTGVNLDLVPAAADDRLAHCPDARLVLVVPERDQVAITGELVSHLARPAEVVTVAVDWRTLSPPGAESAAPEGGGT